MRAKSRAVFAIVAAVFAFAAVGASSASAAEWFVNGKALSGSSKVAEKVKMEESIVLSVPNAGIAITCTGANLYSTSEIVAKSTIKLGSLRLTGCKTTTPASGCEIADSELDTAALEAPLTEGTSPEDKAVFKPKTGTTIANLQFSEKVTCAFGGLWALKGSFTLALPKGQEELVEQTFAGIGTKESPSGLSLFGQPAYLTGKFKASLTSAGKWSYKGTEEKKEKEKEKEPEAGTWYVAGKALASSAKVAEKIKMEESFVLSVPSAGFAFKCTGANLYTTSEIVAKSTIKLGSLRLNGCNTIEPASGCNLEEPNAEIATAALEGTVTKGTSPEDKVVFKPKTGTIIANIQLSEKNTCAYNGLWALKGSFTMSMPNGQEELVEQAFAGLGSTESPSGLTFFGSDPAYLSGKFKASLTSSEKWSSH
jgi:hypothetical protein